MTLLTFSVQRLFGILCLCLLVFSQSVQADVKVQHLKTRRNIQVLYVADHSTELTSVQFAFKGKGSSLDPLGKEGLGALMADLLFDQTKPGLDKRSLDIKLRSLGVRGGIQAGVGPNDIVFSFKAPTNKLKEVFSLFKAVLNDPAFDPKELDKQKNYDPSGARLATAGEIEFATKVLIQKLFNGHPYSNPTYGTLDGRQSVTLLDLKHAVKTRLTRDCLVFSVIGKVSERDLNQYIDDAFGLLTEKSSVQTLPPIQLQTTAETILIPKDSAQAGVVFAQPAIARTNPDYIPLMIANTILAGKSFTSRLWIEAREKRGLVYGITTDIMDWKQTSLLTGRFETDNQKVDEVIALVKDEWKKMKEQGITEAEFEATKKGLMGNFVLNFTQPEGISQFLLATHLAGLPNNYINERNQLLEKITLEDVNRAAKRYLDPEQLSFVIVGNPEGNQQ